MMMITTVIRKTKIETWLVATALALTAISSSVLAQPSPPRTEDRNESPLQQLIDNLDSPSRAIRQRAKENLLAHGQAALPHLRDTEGRSQSVIVICEQLIRRIEAQIEEQTFLGQPITLNHVQSGRQLTEQIRKQTGNIVKWKSSVLLKKSGLPHEPMSFWPMMEQLAQTHHIGWKSYSPNELILTDETSPPLKASSNNGAVRVAIEFHPQQRSFNPKAKKLARAELHLEIEPRFQPYFMSCADENLVLASRNGTFEPFTPTAKREVLFHDSNRVRWRTDFLRIDNTDENNSTKLSGRINLVYASKLVPMQLPLLKNFIDKPTAVENTELNLTEFGLDRDGIFFLDATIKPGWDQSLFTSHRIGLLHRDVELNISNRTVRPTTTELRSVANGVHSLRWGFDVPWKKNTEATFIYTAPAAIHSREIEFTITNFELD